MEIVYNLIVGIACAALGSMATYLFNRHASRKKRNENVKDNLIELMMSIQRLAVGPFLYSPRGNEMKTAFAQLQTYFQVYLDSGGFFFRRRNARFKAEMEKFFSFVKAIDIPDDNQHAPELRDASFDIANSLDRLIMMLSKL